MSKLFFLVCSDKPPYKEFIYEEINHALHKFKELVLLLNVPTIYRVNIIYAEEHNGELLFTHTPILSSKPYGVMSGYCDIKINNDIYVGGIWTKNKGRASSWQSEDIWVMRVKER
jgi:hypothetical protein